MTLEENIALSNETSNNPMLASTAYWTAAIRARETTRNDHLFNDPWAADLAGAKGATWIREHPENSTIATVLRTRYFDDYLNRITSDTAIKQIVLMAAGLDTRAYRLHWPEKIRLFELDQGSVLEYKEQILYNAGVKPACERHPVAVDLTVSWENSLKNSGFYTDQPSAWLLEGLLYYLSKEKLTSLLDKVMCLATPGSYIGFDIINSAVLKSELTKDWVKMQAKSGAPWIGTIDDPEDFLAVRNWKATITHLGAPTTNYDRWPHPVIPATIPGMPHLWFVIAYKD